MRIVQPMVKSKEDNQSLYYLYYTQYSISLIILALISNFDSTLLKTNLYLG